MKSYGNFCQHFDFILVETSFHGYHESVTDCDFSMLGSRLR